MKRQANISKHGIDFADAIRIFEGYTLTVEDTRYVYDEPRYWTIGMVGVIPIFGCAYLRQRKDDPPGFGEKSNEK